MRGKIKEKLEAIYCKGYIEHCSKQSLTSYFAVPKGESDVCMVYDATRSGLNESIWVPSSSLPQAEALTDLLEPTSWMGDIDMGEHFLNFPLDMAV